MADSDITLSVDLDTKDALQTARNLKKELSKEIGKDSSAKGIDLDVKTKNALTDLDAVLKKVDELNAHPVKLDIETEEFQKAQEVLQNAKNAFAEFQSGLSEKGIDLEDLQDTENYIKRFEELPSEIEKLQNRIATQREQIAQYKETPQLKVFVPEEEAKLAKMESRMANLVEEYERLQKMTSGSSMANFNQWQKLNEDIQNADANLKKLQADGKQFQMGPDPKEMEKLNLEIDKHVDKLKLLAVKRKEMHDNSQEGGSEDMIGTAVAAVSGASGKFLAFTKIATKFLKKTVMSVAAITLGVRGLMGIIRKLRRAIIDGFKALTEGDAEFKKKTDEIKKSFEEIKVNLTAAFKPIIEIALPYIQQLLNWINLLISKLAMFIALIAGQNAYTKAIKKTGDAAASASKQLSKFDELNNLSSGGGNKGSEFDFEKLPIDEKMVEMFEKLKTLLEEIKERFKELVGIPFMEGFNAAIGDWQSKLATIKENMKGIGSILWEIFTDPKIAAAQEQYVKSFSKLLGSLTGLMANIGLNLAEALTGGIKDFLKEHKDEIKEDLANMFTIASDVLDNFSRLAVSLSEIVNAIGESTALQDTISNLLGVVYELYSAVELVLLTVLDLVSGTIADIIEENVNNIKNSLEGLFQVLSKVSEFLEVVATTIKNILLRLVNDVIAPLLEFIKPILSQVIEVVLQLWDTISPLLVWLMDEIIELWKGYLEPVLNDVIDLFAAVAEFVGYILTELWNKEIKPVVDYVMRWLPAIMSVVQVAFDFIIFNIQMLIISLSAIIKAVTALVKFVIAIIKGDWKGAWDQAKKFVEVLFFEPFYKMLEMYKTFFEKFVKHMGRLLMGLLDIIVATGEFIVNALVDLINDCFIKIINTATGALNLIPGVNIPSVPEIPKVSWNVTVPALAQGTVIPPSMGEFIAKLGDNNQETEVVSPLSTMKEALKEALKESGGTAGGEIHIHVDLEGREIAKAVVKQNEIYRRSTGRTLFA